jgi:TetR/AcrR family acrAB operon transcriptional repressor
MRRTKEEALTTRENLLSAALRVFSRNGYSATRLEDIAQAAEVTRGAIYHHFGGKEELYKALITEKSVGISQLAQEIIAQGDAPRSILSQLLVRMFQYAEEDADYRALLELHINRVELTPSLQSIMKETIEGRRQLAHFLADLMQRGVEAGEFRANLPVEDAAWALVGFMNGMGLIWVQDQSIFSIGRRAETFVEVFLKGILA